MVGWDDGATLAMRFRAHAGDAQHLYAVTMREMADDWEAGGVVRDIFAGYEDAPSGSALQLRMLAGVFRLVLTGSAPQLRPFYACLGGDAAPSQAWPMMLAVMADHVGTLRTALEVAPQTNEVGRSAALVVGLFDLVAASGTTRVRLLEVGASAGLNLLVDRFAISGDDFRWGPAASTVRLEGAVTGSAHPVEVVITDRRGCDLSPVDATTAAGRLLLTSFVWPFHVHRHDRLAGALAVAQEHPVTVDRAGAAAWLTEQLDRTEPGVLPVVWHSISQLYWSPAEVAAVEQVLAAYGAGHDLGRVGLEFDPAAGPAAGPTASPEIRTELWRPGRSGRHRLLGTAHHHGLPVRLEPEQHH